MKYFFVIFGLVMTALSYAESIPESVDTCDKMHCQALATLEAVDISDNKVVVFQSVKGHQPLFEKKSLSFSEDLQSKPWYSIDVSIDETVDSAPIIGFGGAFSDSAAILYQSLSKESKKRLIRSYFSNEGIAYSAGRVPIASSDFTCRAKKLNEYGEIEVRPALKNCDPILSQYSYMDGNPSLDAFSLQMEDTQYKIPMILDAIASTDEKKLHLFASPWSAPSWMKSNQQMVHGYLLDNYQESWADYFIRFFQEYKKYGVSFWGFTVQNEPEETGFMGSKDMQTWQTMYSTWQMQSTFIENYLGPKLQKYNKDTDQNIKLIVHDDQISTLLDRVGGLMSTGAASYIDGVGLHWYMNNLLPLSNDYQKLDKAFDMLNKDSDSKKKFILGTEACEGYMTGVPGKSGPKLGSWSRAESYAHDILSDLIHHASGWTDWNLVLDMQGGPNWAHNYVDASILVDVEKDKFYRQPMFYYLGHFSKFIRPGAKQIKSQSKGFFPLEEVSYVVDKTPTMPKHYVVTVLNRDSSSRHYWLQVKDKGRVMKHVDLTIPAHSIQSVIFQ